MSELAQSFISSLILNFGQEHPKDLSFCFPRARLREDMLGKKIRTFQKTTSAVFLNLGIFRMAGQGILGADVHTSCQKVHPYWCRSMEFLSEM